MSKIGKQPVDLTGGAVADIDKNHIKIKGPKGELSFDVPTGINATFSNQQIIIRRSSDKPTIRGLHGLTRALIANMVKGVTEGFTKRLEIKGVGYRAQVQEKNLLLNLGFSHVITLAIPEGIQCSVEKNQIVVDGIDKQKVGQFAASTRALRPPEPYKGKGIRYADEIVKLKPGKQAAKTVAVK